MTAADFLATAWETVVQTAGYLFAYAFVLLLAPIAHLALLALAPARRGRLGGRLGAAGAAVAAVTSPLSRKSMERNLQAGASPAAVVTYLAVSDALAAPYWILLGPLLGKDFLLSHVMGIALFGLFAAGLSRGFGVAPAPAPEAPAEPGGLAALLGAAALRYVVLVALGLALGGLVAAWGFSPWAWAPAEIGAGGFWTQLANGGIGIALALLGVPPVANLFVGTYLWKAGLAHAGIVAFFCAVPAAPTRWGLYARVFGRSGAARLVAALLVGALLAGLATAWVFGAADLAIRYKLIPEQLWEVR